MSDTREEFVQREGDEWEKAACGCYVAWDGFEWLVTASSFMCDHQQGDHVDGGPPKESR